MADTRKRAEELHTEAKIMHLDPDLEQQARVQAITRAITDRAAQLLEQQPHLGTEDPRVLYSRIVVPEFVITYESALTRAAMAWLLVEAVDRRDQASFTSGDEAA